MPVRGAEQGPRVSGDVTVDRRDGFGLLVLSIPRGSDPHAVHGAPLPPLESIPPVDGLFSDWDHSIPRGADPHAMRGFPLPPLESIPPWH